MVADDRGQDRGRADAPLSALSLFSRVFQSVLLRSHENTRRVRGRKNPRNGTISVETVSCKRPLAVGQDVRLYPTPYAISNCVNLLCLFKVHSPFSQFIYLFYLFFIRHMIYAQK